MSITRVTRLVASILVFISIIACLALRSSGASTPLKPTVNRLNLDSDEPPIPASEPGKSQQQSQLRQLDDKLPKHLPISVHLKKEKEKAFSELENEKWIRDFEVEVKNTGEKAIYFLRLVLIPEMGKTPSERTPSLTVQYGRDALVSFDAALTPDDAPIQPGDRVFLKIRPTELDGWDHLRKVERWPAEWSKPKKATLMFEMLNFGDGTGFEGGDGVPRQGKKP